MQSQHSLQTKSIIYSGKFLVITVVLVILSSHNAFVKALIIAVFSESYLFLSLTVKFLFITPLRESHTHMVLFYNLIGGTLAEVNSFNPQCYQLFPHTSYIPQMKGQGECDGMGETPTKCRQLDIALSVNAAADFFLQLPYTQLGKCRTLWGEREHAIHYGNKLLDS